MINSNANKGIEQLTLYFHKINIHYNQFIWASISFWARVGASTLNAFNPNKLITNNQFKNEWLAYEVASNNKKLDQISMESKEKHLLF